MSGGVGSGTTLTGETLFCSATAWLVTLYSPLLGDDAMGGITGEETCEERGCGTGGVSDRDRGVGGVWDGVGVTMTAALGPSAMVEYMSLSGSSGGF